MGIFDKLFGKKSSSPTQSKTSPSNHGADEEYIKYIMANNQTVTRNDVVSFMSVLDVFDRTNSKEKTLEAFDSFIAQLASDNPMRAMMVNGFFCGLLGSNMSLSKTEVDTLAKKNTPFILSKLNQK